MSDEALEQQGMVVKKKKKKTGKIFPSKANGKRNHFNQNTEADQCYQQRDGWNEQCQGILVRCEPNMLARHLFFKHRLA